MKWFFAITIPLGVFLLVKVAQESNTEPATVTPLACLGAVLLVVFAVWMLRDPHKELTRQYKDRSRQQVIYRRDYSDGCGEVYITDGYGSTHVMSAEQAVQDGYASRDEMREARNAVDRQPGKLSTWGEVNLTTGVTRRAEYDMSTYNPDDFVSWFNGPDQRVREER